MHRNQYDTDVTVWSPQGRLHQVEYAMEAVNQVCFSFSMTSPPSAPYSRHQHSPPHPHTSPHVQGTACLGLRSKTHVVLAGLKRSPNELASYQKKLGKIDDHMGIAMSGLTADGRSLVKYMRTEALEHKYVYGTAIQASRLVLDLADMHQECTQAYVRRPYGVGLLVAAYDQTGPHLYMTEPSGNYYEYGAMAIGSRSQTSRTYLEKEFDSFGDCSRDELIKHALKALAVSLAGDAELDTKNASIAVVGLDHPFVILEGASLQPFLDAIEVEGGVAPMEADDVVLEDPNL